MSQICPCCGYIGEPVRECHTTEKLFSCPRCGVLIRRIPSTYHPQNSTVFEVRQ